ncbi:MAG: thioredoxin family protein, partial [Firmicutes bacterium]|nr:thioredoxin family protein [Candidatus Scatoplasma merdavium]
MVIHINSTAEFDTQIANNSKVIVDFFATWCGPCKMLSPVLEKIADENPDITVLKVDVDKLSELAVKYAVYS